MFSAVPAMSAFATASTTVATVWFEFGVERLPLIVNVN
jgi:hypothetical protein